MVETICRELLLVLWLGTVYRRHCRQGWCLYQQSIVDLLVNNNIETGNNRQAKEIIIIS